MRNPKRIPKILDKIQKLWEEKPDMRLGQLLENVFPNRPTMDPKYSRSMYNIEDEELVETLTKFYKTEKTFGYKGKEVLQEVLKKVKEA